jgi:predicted nucleotidyltransferase
METSAMNEAAQQFLNQFHKQFPDRKVIFLVRAGSHFFKLNGPNSDKDYRGIYMPSNKEFYEGETKRAMYSCQTQKNSKGLKNTNQDTDFTLFSITKFFNLLSSGDFNMMELLHAPDDVIIIDSEYMQYLRSIRQNILVNDISAFLGFIKKEYKRYAININHYGILQDFLSFLSNFDRLSTLKEIWPELQEHAKVNPQISFTESMVGHGQYVPSIKIAQRLLQSTVRVGYAKESIEHILDRYGHRQKEMAESGVEYKGLYHALRLIYEANDLIHNGEFSIPFDKNRHKTLLDIKNGIIQQQALFDLIDTEIDKLYIYEQRRISNKETVKYLIDKLLFSLCGNKKILYCINNCGIMDKQTGV